MERTQDITKMTSKLRELCVKKNWFTAGSNEQYEKLFQRQREGANLEELAIIVWVCSEDCTKDEIYDTMARTFYCEG